MASIPITFEYQGETYSGELTPVSGAGGANSIWHLMINNYYNGQLHNTDKGWVFHSQTGKFNDLAEYFGDCVVAWTDSQ